MRKIAKITFILIISVLIVFLIYKIRKPESHNPRNKPNQYDSDAKKYLELNKPVIKAMLGDKVILSPGQKVVLDDIGATITYSGIEKYSEGGMPPLNRPVFKIEYRENELFNFFNLKDPYIIDRGIFDNINDSQEAQISVRHIASTCKENPPRYNVNSCWNNVALQLQDESYCYNIEPGQSRNLCIMSANSAN